MVVAIITFAMNTSAYIGEMLRTGIESVDKGQREAGLALGYTPRKSLRPQVKELVEETTSRGFRVKLIL